MQEVGLANEDHSTLYLGPVGKDLPGSTAGLQLNGDPGIRLGAFKITGKISKKKLRAEIDKTG